MSNLRKLTVNLADGSRIEYYGRLDVEELRFPAFFIRCHKSYLVNAAYVFQIKGNTLSMKNDAGELTTIAVSNTFLDSTKKALLRYSAGKLKDKWIK